MSAYIFMHKLSSVFFNAAWFAFVKIPYTVFCISIGGIHMKIKGMVIGAVVFGLVLNTFAALASEPQSLRLVEYAPGQIKWATEQELQQMSDHAHHEGRCGGYIDFTDAGLPKYSFDFVSLIDFTKLQPSQSTTVLPYLDLVDSTALFARVIKLSAYQNRYYESDTGVESANWIAEEYKRIAQGRSDISVRLETHRFKQPSVVVTMQGSGPDKDEIVVLGGHIDSIKQMSLSPKSAKAPGADDNASGTATVMETFRILVEQGFKPNRTIEFMGYAGEEKGLLGSIDIAKRYRDKSKKVVGVMQLDMTMYPGPKTTINLIDDYTDKGLNHFMGKLIDTYIKTPYTFSSCGYACSDHASWNRSGYASTFPTEASLKESNPNIHTPNDTTEGLDPKYGSEFVKLALSFTVEVAQAAAF